jgi:flagellar biosynthesis anti-sigma factor FlgM
MRIHDSNLPAVTTGAQQSQQTGAAGSGRGSGAAKAGADRVTLSSLSEALQSAALNSPERQSRIAELAAAYRSGSYQPDSRAIGQSILADALGAG